MQETTHHCQESESDSDVFLGLVRVQGHWEVYVQAGFDQVRKQGARVHHVITDTQWLGSFTLRTRAVRQTPSLH